MTATISITDKGKTITYHAHHGRATLDLATLIRLNRQRLTLYRLQPATRLSQFQDAAEHSNINVHRTSAERHAIRPFKPHGLSLTRSIVPNLNALSMHGNSIGLDMRRHGLEELRENKITHNKPLKKKTLKTKGAAPPPRPEIKQPKPSQQPKNVNRSTSALRASSLKVTK